MDTRNDQPPTTTDMGREDAVHHSRRSYSDPRNRFFGGPTLLPSAAFQSHDGHSVVDDGSWRPVVESSNRFNVTTEAFWDGFFVGLLVGQIIMFYYPGVIY